jgi:hypothetical protein
MIDVQAFIRSKSWLLLTVVATLMTVVKSCQSQETGMHAMNSTIGPWLNRIVQDRTRRASVRERARIVLSKRERGIRDSHPVLIDVGYVVYKSLLQFDLLVYDDGCDLRGIRIREQSIDPNGVVATLEEEYPVFVFWRYRPLDTLDEYLLDADPRDAGQRKDDISWQQYAERRHDQYTTWMKEGGMAPWRSGVRMPTIWMSIPQQNKMRILVAVYDEAGNESEYVELEKSQGEAGLWYRMATDRRARPEANRAVDVPVGVEAKLQSLIEDRWGLFPAPARERARAGLAKWKSRVRDSRPILLDTGYVNNSRQILFDAYILDDGGDLCGLRLREEHRKADGTVLTLEEDYPVFIAWENEARYEPYCADVFRAVVRDTLERKDSQWRQDAQRLKEEILTGIRPRRWPEGHAPKQYRIDVVPPLSMSIPHPPEVRVFVSVYDRGGRQSEYVELRDTSRMPEYRFGLQQEEERETRGGN